MVEAVEKLSAKLEAQPLDDLEIPVDTWGGKGTFRFTIPASMINDLRGKPSRLQPKDPKAPKKGAELSLGR